MYSGVSVEGLLIGMRYFKYAAKGDRAAGEMLSFHMCPKANGTLDGVQVFSISVPGEQVQATRSFLDSRKQFDHLKVAVDVLPARKENEPPRYMLKGFIEPTASK